jgi:hypothetical protein
MRYTMLSATLLLLGCDTSTEFRGTVALGPSVTAAVENKELVVQAWDGPDPFWEERFTPTSYPFELEAGCVNCTADPWRLFVFIDLQGRPRLTPPTDSDPCIQRDLGAIDGEIIELQTLTLEVGGCPQ